MQPGPALHDDLVATLQRLQAKQSAWAVDLEGGDLSGWRPLSDLWDSEILAGLVGRVAARLGGCETRVAASTLQLGLAARLWCVTVGSAALACELPDLSCFRWRDDRGGVVLRADGLVGVASPTPASLLPQVRARVVEGHLRPLTEAVSAFARISPELLWGNAASALAGLPRVLGLPAADDLVAGLLAQEPLQGHVENARRTRTCCLFYRVDTAGLCGDCVFTHSPTDRPDERA